jgi:hypothetical protein
VCGAIPVHSGPRLLVNWPPPPLSHPIPFSRPQRFPIPIMCPSTTTLWHRLHIVWYSPIKLFLIWYRNSTEHFLTQCRKSTVRTGRCLCISFQGILSP